MCVKFATLYHQEQFPPLLVYCKYSISSFSCNLLTNLCKRAIRKLFNFDCFLFNNISIFPAMCHVITRGAEQRSKFPCFSFLQHSCVFSTHHIGKLLKVSFSRSDDSEWKISIILLWHFFILFIRTLTNFHFSFSTVKEFHVHFNRFS